MSLPTGWICLDGETKFADLSGLDAELICYFANPHRMTVVRFTDAGAVSEPLFLLCTGVTGIQANPTWSVSQLRCVRTDEDTILVEDPRSSFRVTCHAVRVFTGDEFKHWLGKDYTFVNPAPQDFQEVLKDSANV
jgi:hypothetical protein